MHLIIEKLNRYQDIYFITFIHTYIIKQTKGNKLGKNAQKMLQSLPSVKHVSFWHPKADKEHSEPIWAQGYKQAQHIS